MATLRLLIIVALEGEIKKPNPISNSLKPGWSVRPGTIALNHTVQISLTHYDYFPHRDEIFNCLKTVAA